MYSYNDVGAANGSSRRLRFVVIGAGLIGPRHAEHVRAREDCEMFAVVDHSAKGPSVADAFDSLLFKSVDDMVQYCEEYECGYPDAAIIATPNHTHLSIGMKLASKGVHLLVEKPLAPLADDCRTLIRHCREQNVHLLVGHHRRFNPYIVATKESLNNIGRCVAVQGTWALKKPDAYFEEKPWRSSKEKGGGVLLINLIHDIDVLQYLLGPVTRVYAELMPKQRSIEGSSYDELVDEGAVLTLKFANGCCGSFLCSDNVVSPFSFEVGTGENPNIPFNESVSGFYRIFGSEGTLSVPDLNLYHQRGYGQSSGSWSLPVATEKMKMKHEIESHNEEDLEMLTPSPSPNTKDYSVLGNSAQKPKPFDLQIEHFVNLIKGTEIEAKCTGEDALSALLCVEGILKSIETGKPQEIDSLNA